MKSLILLESPYAGDVEINVLYARTAMREAILLHGEAPFASHLLYPFDILDDHDPEERQIGIDTGLEFRRVTAKSVFYIDLGMSSGMKYALDKCIEDNRPTELRTLSDVYRAKFHAERDLILDRRTTEKVKLYSLKS